MFLLIREMSQNIGGNKIYAGNILPDSLKSYKYKAIGVLYAGANPGFQTRGRRRT
jgi:hypothetical protein